MKIQRKTLTNWDLSEIKNQHNHLKEAYCGAEKDVNPCGYIFGLPKAVLEERKLTPIKQKQIKRQNIRNGSELSGYQFPKHYQQLRNTLINRTKQLFKPLKRHYSLLEQRKLNAQNPIISPQQIQKQKNTNRKSQQSSSHRTLQILQKVILKQEDFYAKQRSILELQANKLPIIQNRQYRQNRQNRQQKKMQSLNPYEINLIPNCALIAKYESTPIKIKAKPRKKSVKPYLTGWETAEADL